MAGMTNALGLLIVISSALWGQTRVASNFNPLAAESLVRLEGISVYGGYFTGGAPLGFEVPTPSPFLGSSAVVGAAANFGGSKSGEKASLTWSYSPSYFRSVYSRNNSSADGTLNHSGSLMWTRKLAKKWTLTAAGSGFASNLEQLYFNTVPLSAAVAMPTTFEDLAAGVLTGRFTDPQLALLLTGAPPLGSSEQGYLYGNRLLSATANVAINWSPSDRQSVTLSVAGSRTQHLDNHDNGNAGTLPSNRFLQEMTNATAGVSWSYSLSPRTQVGVGVTASRTFSPLQQGYTSSFSFSAGRTLTRRWFVQGSGGLGMLTYLQNTYGTPRTLSIVFGGGLGYKTAAHTVLGFYNRSIGDSYGLGSSNTSAATGSWNWRIPGSGWALSANLGYQEMSNSTFKNTTSWRAGASVARLLVAHCFFSAQFMYSQSPGTLTVQGIENSQTGLSLSLTWSPSGYR
jgi:hypothetical protein